MASLIAEQLKAQITEVEKLRTDAAESKIRAVQVERDAEIRAVEAESGAKLQMQEEKLKMEEAKAKTLELQLLHNRLEALHTAHLLQETEFFRLEDIITDAAEATEDDDCAPRMAALSARLAGDAAFARQLRRKFL